MNSALLLRCTALLCLTSPFLCAQQTLRWTFDDKSRTELTQLTPAWASDLDGTTTTGRGVLRIRRGLDTPSNTFVRLPDEMLRQPLWLLVHIDAWNLTGTSNETVRLGFSTNDNEKSPSIVAQLKFERQPAGLMFSGESFPNSLPASSLAPVPVGKPAVGGRVSALLHIDPSTRTYHVSYKTAYSNGWQKLGEGSLSTSRNARFLRLGASGPFNTNRAEQFDIDEIVVSTTDPSGS